MQQITHLGIELAVEYSLEKFHHIDVISLVVVIRDIPKIYPSSRRYHRSVLPGVGIEGGVARSWVTWLDFFAPRRLHKGVPPIYMPESMSQCGKHAHLAGIRVHLRALENRRRGWGRAPRGRRGPMQEVQKPSRLIITQKGSLWRSSLPELR